MLTESKLQGGGGGGGEIELGRCYFPYNQTNTLDLVCSVTVAAIVQGLQYDLISAWVIEVRTKVNRACLLAASRVFY